MIRLTPSRQTEEKGSCDAPVEIECHAVFLKQPLELVDQLRRRPMLGDTPDRVVTCTSVRNHMIGICMHSVGTEWDTVT
jgi:hypothetical protein